MRGNVSSYHSCGFQRVTDEVHNRLTRVVGLSATRKRSLLRDCKYFADIEQRARTRGAAAGSAGSAMPSTCLGRRSTNCFNPPHSLTSVLRSVAEFLAAVGRCDDSASCGKKVGCSDWITGHMALERALLVLQLTGSALCMSNNRLDSIRALGSEWEGNRGDACLATPPESSGSGGHRMCETECSGLATGDEAPLTPMEAVTLMKWCASHIEVALELFTAEQQEGKRLWDPRRICSTVLQLLEWFLTTLVCEGLQRCAIDSTADELVLSDLAYNVTRQSLRVLNACLPTSTANDSYSSVASSAVDVAELYIAEPIQQVLLCSQRERWERALALLVETQSWNERLASGADAGTAGASGAGARGEIGVCGRPDGVTMRVLASVPQGILQTFQYILAQHGQWKLCMELWRRCACRGLSHFKAHGDPSELPSHTAALSNSPDLNNVITALAFVNSGAYIPSDGTDSKSTTLLSRLLRLLLTLGVVPQRIFTAAEFASVLRQSFGLQLRNTGENKICSVTDILSPAVVWQATGGQSPRVRAALCLLCFNVSMRSGLVHTLRLEDLYVVASASRQLLQGIASTGVVHAASQTSVSHGGGPGSCCTFTSTLTMEGSDAFATNTFPPIFSAATRRMVVASEGHIVALAEAFLARRCEFLSFGGVFQDSTTQNPTRSPTAIHRALNVTRETGCIRGSGSAVMLYLVSKELMKLLAMTPYVSTLGTTWLAALCALSIGVELGAPRRPFAPGAVAALARAMSKMSLEAGDAGLFEPLVRLAPHLSPFVVGRIVLDRTCRLLSWAHCLQLLPYTLCGSTAQRVLLRRIMSAHHVGFLPSVCHFLSSAALPTKLFSHSAPAYQTDLRTLLLLAERNWQRALWTYQHADDRTQRACAHHVARLVLYAEAWLPRARVHSGDSRALTGRCQFETLFINALRSSEGDRVAEDVLQFCLQRGLWAGGLAFHHAIREADPNLLEANRKIETYTSLLCKGLINHTTLAHTIVDVTRFARMARWSEACAAFVQYSFGDSENTKLCSTAPSHPSSCGYWPTILSVDMPRQLSHLAHTVRYSALCCADIWERALEWVPASSLPLPLHHELLLSQRVGRPTNPTRPISIITNGGAPAPATELPVPLSMSLVQVAMREKLHRVSEPETRASFATVERTLRALRHRGQWEQAVLVCEHALARRCFPHSASAVVVAACLPSWKAAVRCYLHLSQRMRPDTATTALALEACEHGGQWTLSLRILQQCMLTYPRGSAAVAAPRIIDSAVRAALRSGAWVAALPIVRQCRHTHNSCLANTILQTYMQAQQYDDAVNFFYDCVRRGVRPLDESLALVIKASEAVSAEYRDVARFAGVIASTLEDFCHVHGMLLEHVLVVCRGMSSCPRVTVVALAHGHEFTYVRTGALCHRGSAGFSN